MDKERSVSSPISSEGNTFVKKEVNVLGKNVSNLTGTINVDYENLTIQKNIDVNPCTWDELYKRCQINKNGNEILPSDWTDAISAILAEALIFCCIVFKKHNIYKKNTEKIVTKNKTKIAKFWYYCRIEGCKLEGTAILNSSYSIASTNTSKSFHSMFLEDEMKRFGYTSHSVPILCATDCSWPILKCLVESFKQNLLFISLCAIPDKIACQQWDSNPKCRLLPERNALDHSAILEILCAIL